MSDRRKSWWKHNTYRGRVMAISEAPNGTLVVTLTLDRNVPDDDGKPKKRKAKR